MSRVVEVKSVILLDRMFEFVLESFLVWQGGSYCHASKTWKTGVVSDGKLGKFDENLNTVMSQHGFSPF